MGQPMPALPGGVPSPSQWPAGCHFQMRCAYAREACAAGVIPLHAAMVGSAVRCIRADHLTDGHGPEVARPATPVEERS